jgi:hypothetical protein
VKSRRFSVWQKVVALAPLLMLAVYLPGQVMSRCRMNGLLRPACCCPADDQAENAVAALKAADCCDREIAQTVRPVVDAATPTEPGFNPAAAVAALLPSVPLLSAPAERFDWALQRHGPAREGPPLVLLKHAFLI